MTLTNFVKIWNQKISTLINYKIIISISEFNFENVILLSCNESFLPGVAPSNSLVPFDLKLFLKLPTKSDREAIFAYYFYRIIQRAKNVHLVYNDGIASQLDSNEISRYIIQIENEFKDIPSITLKKHHINYDERNYCT